MVVMMEVTLEAMMAESNEFRVCSIQISCEWIEDGYWLGLSLTTETTFIFFECFFCRFGLMDGLLLSRYIHAFVCG